MRDIVSHKDISIRLLFYTDGEIVVISYEETEEWTTDRLRSVLGL
jgi:hypothetical protein